MKETANVTIAGALCAGVITAAVWSIPVFMPDNYRHAAGIAPSAMAYIPFIETQAHRLRTDINHRFAFAPDVVHAMAIGVALDPSYPLSRVKELDSDLLLSSYQSDIERVLGGRNIATHSSILGVAAKAGRMDIARVILERGGADTFDAKRVAIEAAKSLSTADDQNAKLYLEAFAMAGGRPEQAKLADGTTTLAQMLLTSAPELLLLFEDNGFDPWSSLDPVNRSFEGLSLAEIASLKGNGSDLRGLGVLLSQSRGKPSARVLTNVRDNLIARAKKPSLVESLLQKLESRMSDA